MVERKKKSAKKAPAKRATRKSKRDHPLYSSSVVSDVSFFADKDAQLLRITFDIVTISARLDSTGENKSETSKPIRRETTIPLGLFKDEAQRSHWCMKVRKVYHETLADALLGEAGIHLDLVTNMLLNDLGIVKVDLPGVIDALAAMRAKGAKLSMHLPLKGRYSQWTPAELTLAVRGAIHAIPANEKKDYENVAFKLQKSHPDKAPKTGDALRKLMSRLDVKWKDLKSGQ